MTWDDRAECRGTSEEIFFPPGRNPDYTAAQRICIGCQVRPICLVDVMAYEHGRPVDHRHGVWGGLTPGQRARLDGMGRSKP